MFNKFCMTVHDWNQPISILTPDLSSMERDQISRGTNLSSSFELKKEVCTSRDLTPLGDWYEVVNMDLLIQNDIVSFIDKIDLKNDIV